MQLKNEVKRQEATWTYCDDTGHGHHGRQPEYVKIEPCKGFDKYATHVV